MIKHIVAIDSANGFAKMVDGTLGIPWDIPADKQQYRNHILGKRVLVGHATYRLGRAVEYSYVLSDDAGLVIPAGEGMRVSTAAEAIKDNGDRDLWVIGGLSVYAATLDAEAAECFADELYITCVAGDFACDRHYPAIPAVFRRVFRSEQCEDNGYSFHIEQYVRTS